jgi:hypothetical protein
VSQRLSQMPGILSVERTGVQDSVVQLAVSTVKDRDMRAELAAAIVGAGWDLHEMRSVTLSLESIFLSLVSGKPAQETL